MYLRLFTIPILAIITTIGSIASLSATAQIIPNCAECRGLRPDRTLGSENSVVTPNVNIRGVNSDRIDGGAIRGGNLFHSFQEFNVEEGQGVYFSNPDNIINILTRVTGGNISEILGTLGVLGNANLFLINPNGIVFGPNARLDVGGSFFATTADGILFENGVEFAASNPETPPLLTINMPLGLNIRENPGSIINQSVAVDSEDNLVGLQVQPRKTLGFVGGDIRIEGGILTAPQGRIELGSVEGNNFVSLTPIDKGYALDYENVQNFRDISLSQAAFVDVWGEGGGDVQIQGRRVTLADGSVIEASTLGSESGGLLSIQASESVEVFGGGIFADVNPGATGAGGSLAIETQRLLVSDDSLIGVDTFGQGNGGQLIIRATNSVEVTGASSFITADVGFEATGTGGNIIIETQNLRVDDGALISASTFGNGDAGDINVTATDVKLIGTTPDGQFPSGLFASAEPESKGKGGALTINTERLLLQDGAQISATTRGNGDGGDITLTAMDVELIGIDTSANVLFTSAIGASVEPESTGNGGTITINTQRLLLQDGAQIGTGTSGNGNGGNLTVTATDIELIGTSSDGRAFSTLATLVESGGTGNGGDLSINTQRLFIQDGAQVSTATFSNGDGGNLTITATDIELIGISADGRLPSILAASVQPGGTGNSGTLSIKTERLQVRDGAQIQTATFGNGDGGDLSITATDIELIGTSADGQTSSGLFASVEPESTGQGGILTVNTDQLTVRDGAVIDVRSEGIEAAGDLIVNAQSILLDNQASLNGETTAGQGNIILNTEDLRLRRNSNITTNATGVATGGNIEINTDILVAIEDSDISANAEEAFGGQVIINADAIFATEFRERQTGASDITATSELGSQFSGTVELNTEFDTSSGLVDLPQTIIDPAALIAQDPCKQGQNSEFFLIGRGGIAPNPTEDLPTIQGLAELELIEPVTPPVNRSSQRRQQRTRKRDNNRENHPIDSRTIIPARGWIRTPEGEVILVGYDPTKTGIIRQHLDSSRLRSMQAARCRPCISAALNVRVAEGSTSTNSKSM